MEERDKPGFVREPALESFNGDTYFLDWLQKSSERAIKCWLRHPYLEDLKSTMTESFKVKTAMDSSREILEALATLK